MNYKGYSAVVEYDDEAGIIYGRVVGIKDIIDFQTDDLKKVRQEFMNSVDDYLEFCEARGESPDKSYSGKLVFRTSPEIHRELAIAADCSGKSINQMLEEAVIQHVSQEIHRQP